MTYAESSEHHDLCVGSPQLIYRNDNFLSPEEIKHYQSLLHNQRWGLSDHPTLDQINFISQSLYQHYAWNGQWDQARWLDSTPLDWEHLYDKISKHLPPHYLHWVDVKITGPLQKGTPIHRDKDPWSSGGDIKKFSQSILIICNLNGEWDENWGGGLILHNTTKNKSSLEYSINQTVPVVPGQLLIMYNCAHSIELITEPCRSRISLILQALQYKENFNDSNT
jgi:hypothetical protein